MSAIRSAIMVPAALVGVPPVVEQAGADVVGGGGDGQPAAVAVAGEAAADAAAVTQPVERVAFPCLALPPVDVERDGGGAGGQAGEGAAGVDLG
jgi:hypothetical protein